MSFRELLNWNEERLLDCRYGDDGYVGAKVNWYGSVETIPEEVESGSGFEYFLMIESMSMACIV